MLRRILYIMYFIASSTLSPDVNVRGLSGPLLSTTCENFDQLRDHAAEELGMPASDIRFLQGTHEVKDFTEQIEETAPGVPVEITLLVTQTPERRILEELPGWGGQMEQEITRHGELLNVKMLDSPAQRSPASEHNVGARLKDARGIVFCKKESRRFLYGTKVDTRLIKPKHASELVLNGLYLHDELKRWVAKVDSIDTRNILEDFLREKRISRSKCRTFIYIELGNEFVLRLEESVAMPLDRLTSEMPEEDMSKLVDVIADHYEVSVLYKDIFPGYITIFSFQARRENTAAIVPFVISKVLPGLSDIFRPEMIDLTWGRRDIY